MNTDKVRFNPVAIKNYLFDEHLVKEYHPSWEMVKVSKDKEEKESHWIITLINNVILDIRYNIKDKHIFINNVILNNWEEFKAYLEEIKI